MNDTMLLILDQLRYIISLLAAQWVFLVNAVPRRGHFGVRAVCGYAVCLLGALVYVPLYGWLTRQNNLVVFGAVSAVYWTGMMFLTCTVQWYCFDAGPCNILFRCIAGGALESVSTTVLRSLMIAQWMPELPSKHTLLYILLAVTVYAVFYYFIYRILARPLQRGADVGVPENRKTARVFVLLYIGYSLIIDLSKGISEWMLVPINTEELYTLYKTVQYFSILVMVLVSTVILLILYYIYEIGALQTERSLLGQLMAEKAAQYERSKESIEAINRKCHDLKHQLLALQVAGDQERQAMIHETQKAVMFYEAVVKTGNEVLDTLLTEKSTICAYHNIRLSCTVNTKRMDRIGVVDLYTMLGNAIDNAIECVQQFSDDEKKTISLSILEKGQMLLISVENYYEKTIYMQGDYPVTSKKDAENHGIGIKSIAMVAKRYGGSARVSTEDQIFQLQIVIPIK